MAAWQSRRPAGGSRNPTVEVADGTGRSGVRKPAFDRSSKCGISILRIAALLTLYRAKELSSAFPLESVSCPFDCLPA